MITIFRDIKELESPYFRTVDFVLERIRTECSKDLIEKIRDQPEKTLRNALKKKLPSILFSGKFPNRKKGVIPFSHSGFIAIDIDNIEKDKLQEEKRIICKSEYIYSCFLSPSGNGFKALIKIPADIKRHVEYFNGIEKYFAEAMDIEIDTSGKNIGRVCYESIDKDIYINKESKIFTDLIESIVPEKQNNTPTIAVTDLDEIEKRVVAWWQKNYTYIDGSKHHSIIALAGAFNRFGVSESRALSYCNSLSSNPVSHKANEQRIKYFYTKFSHLHNTKKLEDVKKTRDLTSRISGQDSDIAIEVLREYAEFETQTPIELEEVVKNIQTNEKKKKQSTGRIFWQYDDGKLKIDIAELKTFINDCGFFTYYPVKEPDSYQFVHVENNIIRNVDTREIKNAVLQFVLDNNQSAVYNLLNERTKYWTKQFLNVLPKIDPPILRDNKNIAFFPTRSGVFKVSKKGIEKIDYVDLTEGCVWESQITEKDFSYTSPDGDFKKFTYNLSGGDDNFKSLTSILGYLMHNYKDPSNSKAVFLYDKNISQIDGEPEGGSGKSIFFEGIKKLRDVACITGDRIDFSKSFALQEVSESTQLVWIDEPDKNIDMKTFFSRITNGLPIEKKNKNAIYIPNEKSPKFGFSTNFKPKGVSASHKRRRVDFGVSSHYNINHTPRDEFHRNFFTEWDDEQWNAFFSFYLECVKEFLMNGITEQTDVDNDFLEFATEFGVEFASYLLHDGILSQWIAVGKIMAVASYNKFVFEYETEISIKNFLFCVRKVLSLKNIKYKESGRAEKRVFILEK